MIDLDGTMRTLSDGVMLTNGLGFSPDGKRLYHSDARAALVRVYDVKADGSVGPWRSSRRSASESVPDGMKVAADGSVWVADARGGRVAVFDQDGAHRKDLPVPLPMVTSLCFGGDDLQDLYIVTGSDGGPGELRQHLPHDPGRGRRPAAAAGARCSLIEKSHESIRLRPAGLRRETRPSQGRRRSCRIRCASGTSSPDVAVRTYAEHLDAWEEIDRLGYDGVGFNEHHCSPYGLMNSPNLMAAAAAQRTKRLKLLIYGNLLPLHEPLRLAEELAMLDCLSNGRLISGFARGIPREYQVHNVPLAESRARFEEAFEIVTRAWTEDVFSYEGKFWSYKDVAIWPRPVQQPHPEIWIPIVGSKESIEFAGRHNIPHHAGPGAAADCRTTSSPITQVPGRERPSHHARPPVARRQRLCRRLARRRR